MGVKQPGKTPAPHSNSPRGSCSSVAPCLRAPYSFGARLKLSVPLLIADPDAVCNKDHYCRGT